MNFRQRIQSAVKTPLFNFQIQGVHFVNECKGRCIIGDDMGLGKTLQCITWIAIHPEVRPVVVICPASLKFVWENQLKDHAGLYSQVCSGQNPGKTDSDILIINYDILKYWRNVLCRRIKPQLMVVDEFQAIRNTGIGRTKVCQRLARQVKYLIALSGTPIHNRPIEFFPILQMIDREEWPSKMKFGFRYCEPTRGYGRYDLEFNGAANLDELHQKVSRIMIRRTKEEVLPDLPKKIRTIIPMDFDRKEYDSAEWNFLSWYKEKKGEEAHEKAKKAEAVVKINALKRLACEAILPQAFEWINEYLEGTDQKLLVISVHQNIQTALKKKFPKAAVIDASRTTEQRQAEMERFQSDKRCRLLLGGLIPCGTGWTLTAASSVLFVEIGWVPTETDQAEDRIYRIGQKADCVNAYYLVPRQTVVEDTLAVHDKKRRVISQVIDGHEKGADFEVLDGILAALKRRAKNA